MEAVGGLEHGEGIVRALMEHRNRTWYYSAVMEKKRLMTILRRDYVSTTLIGSMLLFWVAAAAALLLPSGSFGYLFAALTLTAVTIPVTIIRLHRLGRLLREGKIVRGEVRRAYYQLLRGRLEIGYSANGKDYVAVQPFLNSPGIPRFNPGTTIRVLVDPEVPQRATVPALFDTD